MSSRTAACGQPPVSTAMMRSLGMLVGEENRRGGDARWEGVVLGEELAVFAGEDVVCYGGDGEAGSEGFAEGQHEGCLAGAYGSVQVSISTDLEA